MYHGEGGFRTDLNCAKGKITENKIILKFQGNKNGGLTEALQGKRRIKWEDEASLEGLLVKGKKEIKDSQKQKRMIKSENMPIPFQQLPAKKFVE